MTATHRIALAAIATLAALFAAACSTTNQADGNADSTTGTAFRMAPDLWTRAGNRPGSGTTIGADGFDKLADGQYRDMSLAVPLVDAEGPVVTSRTTTKPDGTVIEEEIPVAMYYYLSDPTDGTIEGFASGFDEHNRFYTRIAKAGNTHSTVIASYDRQIIQSLLTAGQITEAKAQVAMRAIDAGASLAEAAAAAGFKLLGVPTSP